MHTKTVAIVGGLDTANEIADLVAKTGAQSIIIPAITFKKLRLGRADIELLKKIHDFDWIFFTSKNAVLFFAEEIRARGIVLPQKLKIAAVGLATASAARSLGMKVNFIPKQFSADNLASEFAAKHGSKIAGIKILFPGSDMSSRTLSLFVPKNSTKIICMHFYTTIPAKIPLKLLKQLQQEKVTHIVFTSPSSVASFVQNSARSIRSKKSATFSIPAICIGLATAKAARAAKFTQILVPKASNAAGIASLLRSLP